MDRSPDASGLPDARAQYKQALRRAQEVRRALLANRCTVEDLDQALEAVHEAEAALRGHAQERQERQERTS